MGSLPTHVYVGLGTMFLAFFAFLAWMEWDFRRFCKRLEEDD